MMTSAGRPLAWAVLRSVDSAVDSAAGSAVGSEAAGRSTWRTCSWEAAEEAGEGTAGAGIPTGSRPSCERARACCHTLLSNQRSWRDLEIEREQSALLRLVSGLYRDID